MQVQNVVCDQDQWFSQNPKVENDCYVDPPNIGRAVIKFSGVIVLLMALLAIVK